MNEYTQETLTLQMEHQSRSILGTLVSDKEKKKKARESSAESRPATGKKKKEIELDYHQFFKRF